MSTTFNTLNDVSKKQRMLFLADSMSSLFSPIAYATSANLSFSADDVDVSNKMDGGWATSMQGKKSAEVSVDALCAYKQGLTGETELQAGWNADKRYAFLYIMTTVEEQADGSTKLKYDVSVPFYYGYMKLSSLELTSDNGDVAKFSVSGKSHGNVTCAPPYGLIVLIQSATTTYMSFKMWTANLVYVGEAFTDLTGDGSISKSFGAGDSSWTWNQSLLRFDKPKSEIYKNGVVGILLIEHSMKYTVVLHEEEASVSTLSLDEETEAE